MACGLLRAGRALAGLGWFSSEEAGPGAPPSPHHRPSLQGSGSSPFAPSPPVLNTAVWSLGASDPVRPLHFPSTLPPTVTLVGLAGPRAGLCMRFPGPEPSVQPRLSSEANVAGPTLLPAASGPGQCPPGRRTWEGQASGRASQSPGLEPPTDTRQLANSPNGS